jgi:methylated-DNA-[protein]-cysteine S-methyltransferase
MTIFAARIPSPMAEMVAAVDDDGALVLLEFADRRPLGEIVGGLGEVIWSDAPLAEVRRQLGEYFAGRRRRFDLAVAAAGSEFQLRVWRALREIPFGATTTYGELAAVLGRAGASRAVGRANATNPVCVVTPCHRVIGKDGSLTGFGGGIEKKRWLLDHESAQRRLL